MFLQLLLGCRSATLEDIQWITIEYRFAQLLGGQLDDLWIGWYWSFAEVAKDHVPILWIELLPASLGSVEVGLLEIDLRNWSDRGAESSQPDDFLHLLDHLGVEVQRTGIPHHHRVGGQCSTWHW